MRFALSFKRSLATMTLGLGLVAGAAIAADEELVKIDIKIPKPAYTGTPKNVLQGTTVDPKSIGKVRTEWKAPKGTELLSLKKPVTSSDKEPIIGKLEQITDGDKEGIEGNWVELAPGLQWVQVDLGQSQLIHGILVWHHHADPRVYRDVVIQVSDDPDFISGVTTIFNNDQDNSSGLGVGKAREYVEGYDGNMFDAPKGGIKARYVRTYSKGNTNDDQNHYTEIEVYGIAAK